MRKGQAALEFLMTYGWAILVVLAAIGALAYFGVLSPDKFLPEKCTLPAGLACLDFRATSSGLDLIIQNSIGFDLDAVSLTINGTDCSVTASGPTTLNNGDQGTFAASCTPPSGKFKGAVSIAYTRADTGLSNTKSGDIVVQIP